MSSYRWGPIFWAFFHIITLNYPDDPTGEEINLAKDLIKSIYYILPCRMCRDHYLENITANPLKSDDTSSKNKFMAWFINFHNIVNKITGKNILPYNDAIKKINMLNNYKYPDMFSRVLGYVDVNKISEKEKRNIIRFIKCGLYFGKIEKKNINLDFTNDATYKVLIQKLF
jgi:hypothetical protein